MKRALEDLDDNECVIVYSRLSTQEKRTCLGHVLPDVKNITVYTSSSLWRDILNILVRYVDLQTWSRMRRVCHMFNNNMPDFPDLKILEEVYSRVTLTENDLRVWRMDNFKYREKCNLYYTACVRRLILYAHQLSRQSFRLDVAMARARTMYDTTHVLLPFGKKKVYVSRNGFIRQNKGTILGNVFTMDWKNTLQSMSAYEGGVGFKKYFAMSKKEKNHSQRQKKQYENQNLYN